MYNSFLRSTTHDHFHFPLSFAFLYFEIFLDWINKYHRNFYLSKTKYERFMILMQIWGRMECPEPVLKLICRKQIPTKHIWYFLVKLSSLAKHPSPNRFRVIERFKKEWIWWIWIGGDSTPTKTLGQRKEKERGRK